MRRVLSRIASRAVAALLIGALGGGAAAAPDTLGARSDEPRAFGYTVGDVVSRRITLQVPDGLRLDPDSLPRPGARGRALELQRVVLHQSLAGVPEALQLDYQVFLAPREVRVLEMPPIELRFGGLARPRVPARGSDSGSSSRPLGTRSAMRRDTTSPTM